MRKTPLVPRGERLQVLIQKEGEYFPGPETHHHRMRRTTPLVLSGEKLVSPATEKEG
jgi:hypothetical protein